MEAGSCDHRWEWTHDVRPASVPAAIRVPKRWGFHAFCGRCQGKATFLYPEKEK